jgi:hypothetical protein
MKTAVPEFTDKVAFAIGTGRCGTHFLSQILAYEPDIAAAHERNRLNETFQRYCQWYNLPVDHGGFLHTKEQEIRADLRHKSFSFEASAYLSCSVLELYERFGARFILMVRRPEAVVNSYWGKGWYETDPVYTDANKALGFNWYQESHPHHPFARLAPVGPERDSWMQLSRVGKLAWYWNALNTAVIAQFAQIPATHWQIARLEDFSFASYQEIMQFLGWPSTLSPDKFQQIAQKRPGKREQKYTIHQWSAEAQKEFEEQVKPMALRFNYPFRYAELPLPTSQTKVATTSLAHHLKDKPAQAKNWLVQRVLPGK